MRIVREACIIMKRVEAQVKTILWELYLKCCFQNLLKRRNSNGQKTHEKMLTISGH
jgi:hypothetical protein